MCIYITLYQHTPSPECSDYDNANTLTHTHVITIMIKIRDSLHVFFFFYFSSISSGRSAAGLKGEMTVIMTAGRNKALIDDQAARPGLEAFTWPEASLKLRHVVRHPRVCPSAYPAIAFLKFHVCTDLHTLRSISCLGHDTDV